MMPRPEYCVGDLCIYCVFDEFAALPGWYIVRLGEDGSERLYCHSSELWACVISIEKEVSNCCLFFDCDAAKKFVDDNAQFRILGSTVKKLNIKSIETLIGKV